MSRAGTIQRATPSLITMLGLGLSLAWVLGGAWYLGALGLLCDAVDGWSSRRLQAVSDYGSLLDWSVDIIVSALILSRLHLVPLLVLLIPVQVWLRLQNQHVSGRTMLTAAALASGWVR